TLFPYTTLFRSLRAGVRDRDELAPLRLRVLLRVKPPQVAHPDDGGSDFLHENAIMPARAATPEVKCPPRPRPTEWHPWCASRACASVTARCRGRSASSPFSA